MARIAVIVGHVHSVRASAIELSRRLAADGHDLLVVVPTDSPPVTGVPSVEHDIPHVGRAVELDDADRPPLAALRSFGARRRRAVLDRVDPRITVLLDEHDADLAIVDAELVTIVANVLATGRRTALLTLFPGITRDLARPPSHTAVVPGRGLAGTRAGIALHWLRFRLTSELTWCRRWLRGRGDSDRDRARRLARHLGLPRGTTRNHHWIQPLTYPGLPVLETNLAELDLPSTPDPRRHLVGPMVLPPTDPDEMDVGVAADVARVVAARAAGEQVVYCSFGSFATSYDADLLQRVIDAVETIDGARLVVGLGGGPESTAQLRGRLRTTTDTILFDWAPQRTLLQHADAAVIHGGAQSLWECVAAAVPVVVLPMVLDQPGFAARVAYHRVGAIGPDDAAAEPLGTMVDRIEHVLRRPPVRERMASMSRALHAAREDRLLEDAVASILAG